MSRKPDKSALSSIRELRRELEADSEDFAAAIQTEDQADELCASVRDFLVQARIEAGLDQKTLGKRLDYNQSTVSRFERGSGDISLKLAFRIARALGYEIQLGFRPVGQGAASAQAAVAVEPSIGIMEEAEKILSERLNEIVHETMEAARQRLETA